MQFDQTHVVVRQRNPAEVADLMLLVLHRYGASILLVWAIGVIPFFIANAFLFGWIPLEATQNDLMDDEIFSEYSRYVWLMTVVVYLQSPWACSLVTLWLGRAVFQHRPTAREVLGDFRQTFWRSLLVLGIFRGPLPIMLMLATNWYQPLGIGREVVWLIIIMLILGIQRLARPFVPEIVLLERCPMKATKGGGLSASKRSHFLHTPASAEISTRTMFSGILALSAVPILMGAFVFLRTYLANRVGWGLDVSLILFPLALWLTAGVCTVLRFLNYLDTRIRLEGWEVELTLRAEADRWMATEQSPTTR